MSEANRVEPLDYAGAFTPAARRWSCLAVASAVLVGATAGLSGMLLWLLNENRLPSHFLCCNHAWVTVVVFVGMPSAGALGAIVAIVRIARRRPTLRGLALAIPALLLNLLLAMLGVMIYGGLKA